MRAGRLRHKITLQSATEAQQADGSITKTWGTLATVYAGVEPISGKEQIAGGAEVGTITHRVIIRYLSTVTSKCRVMFGSRVLNISAVITRDERNREMELLCTEGAEGIGG